MNRYLIKNGEQILAEVFADSADEALSIFEREERRTSAGLEAVRA